MSETRDQAGQDSAGQTPAGPDGTSRHGPYNLFPCILLAWLVIGAVVIALTPKLVRRVGAGLARDLDLPAGRVAGELQPDAADG
jgi:hypothetical protein